MNCLVFVLAGYTADTWVSSSLYLLASLDCVLATLCLTAVW